MQMDENERCRAISRRRIVGGAIGAAVAAAGPAIAQDSNRQAGRRPDSELRMDNPVSSIPNRHLENRPSHGQAWQAIWIQSQTTAKTPISVRDGWSVEKPL